MWARQHKSGTYWARFSGTYWARPWRDPLSTLYEWDLGSGRPRAVEPASHERSGSAMRLSYRHVSLLQAMLISELQLHDRQTGGLSRPCHKGGVSSDFWFIENPKNKIGKSPKQKLNINKKQRIKTSDIKTNNKKQRSHNNKNKNIKQHEIQNSKTQKQTYYKIIIQNTKHQNIQKQKNVTKSNTSMCGISCVRY